MTNDQEPNDHLKAAAKASGTFYFKQFKVEDGRSTMKVGTDAVLLGAVAEPGEAARILEIGTGCGVIALMLAQRSKALIEAIEIDEESVVQAKENIGNSPWKGRITVIHSSFQDFKVKTESKYELIISNPPFFIRSLKSPCNKRNLSRHNDQLSYEELISGTLRLLSHEGSLWIILPAKESEEFIETASRSGLFNHYKLRITPKEEKTAHRIILQFKRIPVEKVFERSLVIKTANGLYTQEYRKATKEFYIDF